MQTKQHQTSKLLREYTSLAVTYDQRWSAYIDASLAMTLLALDGLPTDRVLDVACGTGQWLEILANRCDESELFGIDRVPAMLNVAQQRIGQRATLVEADAVELPFDNGEFQLVTITNALHYFTDVDSVLTEARRVLARSGSLIITDWCRDYFWMKLLNRVLPWTQHAHGQTLSSGELERSLTLAGFDIVCSENKKIDGFWGLMTVRAARKKHDKLSDLR